MFDSWGDGWNGATYTVTDANGTVMASGGLASGSAGTDTICLPDGCYDISVGGGSFDSEITFNFGSLTGAAAGTYNVCFNVAVLGCTDPAADNFDSAATQDDGSCIFSGCTDPTASNYDANATVDDGSCTYPCTDNAIDMVMFDSWGDGWNGATYTVTDGTTTATGGLTTGSTATDALCLPDGCYDVTVGGGTYDSEITFDFGSLVGATAGTYQVAVGAGSCAVFGCTDSTADNYDPAADTDDGSCIISGCTDPAADNYNASANNDDGSCTYTILGCTDPNADNYDSSATSDDGSCSYCSTFALSIDSQSDASAAGACDGSAVVSGSGGTSPYSISWPADPTTLCAGTYTVTATDAEGCTASIDVTIGEPSVAVCSAPTGLNTYNVVHTRATFNFNSTGADYYKIRVKENGGAWQVITQLGTATGTPGGNTKTKYFLTSDASYEWQVRAWCIDGSVSGWSSSAFFNTLPDCPNADNLYASDIEAEWAVLNWDAPTTTVAGVNYYLARIQEDGASAWNIVTPANGGTDNFKLKGQLIPGATYNFEVRTWCNTGDANNPTDPYYKSDWGGMVHFQTIPCPIQTFNLSTTNVNATTQFFGADFIADGTTPYDHFTLRFREVGATAWQFRSITAAHIAAGGRNVGGLTTGATYEWGIRTFCGTGSTWKSPWASGPDFTAGSSSKLAGSVTALEVYPNPSDDIFNIGFVSEEAQTINVKVVNMIGEVVYTENLEEFMGNYANSIDMNTQPKGVYFLEITTNNGSMNHKIVLQ